MVSVGQPLDVAVTLPQRGGGWVSESCGPERAFLRAAAARIDQFDHSLGPRAIIAAPHLERPPPPLAGSEFRLRNELSGGFQKSFLVCHRYLTLAYRLGRGLLISRITLRLIITARAHWLRRASKPSGAAASVRARRGSPAASTLDISEALPKLRRGRHGTERSRATPPRRRRAVT